MKKISIVHEFPLIAPMTPPSIRALKYQHASNSLELF